ncbi:hypothetical protein pmac_cds_571 [Pandoravirus macleodensis]|uniref:Uncharacterized protein n=1 Tax=Pandoravirus macleodensis TaxID=2107707 RepID=A0A2U7UFJ9_9VIRU|nr:hypothetical protein pmac_cds_571 [Pandoravirus macleodensis]AVK77259.1 hypothetical protein pmac_cds_571 [Pandoravirus macleodensis]
MDSAVPAGMTRALPNAGPHRASPVSPVTIQEPCPEEWRSVYNIGNLAVERYVKNRVSSCKEQRIATLIDAFYLVRFPNQHDAILVDRLSWPTIEACLWCAAERVSLIEGTVPRCVARALDLLHRTPPLPPSVDEQREIRSVVRDLLPIILVPLCDGVHHNDICRALPTDAASGSVCSEYRAAHQTLADLVARPMLASSRECIIHEYEPSVSDHVVVESPTDSSYRRCHKPSCKRFAAPGISVCRSHRESENRRRQLKKAQAGSTK